MKASRRSRRSALAVAVCAAAFAFEPAAVRAAELESELAPESEGAEERERRRHERRPAASLLVFESFGRGAVLAAGATVELRWRPGPELLRSGRVREWEAFLSLDGGARWPVRLTPHLDLDRRSVAVRLPAVATRRARLLFRFGDERRELEVELPWTFTIAVAPPVALAPRPSLVAGAGEPARPGGEGVVSWVEGGGRGGTWRTIESSENRPGARAPRAVPPGLWFAAAPTRVRPSLSAAAPLVRPASSVLPAPAPPSARTSPRRRDPQSLSTRRNE